MTATLRDLWPLYAVVVPLAAWAITHALRRAHAGQRALAARLAAGDAARQAMQPDDAVGALATARHREERQTERTAIWCQRNAEVRAQLLEGWPTSDADSDELTDANDMGRAAA